MGPAGEYNRKRKDKLNTLPRPVLGWRKADLELASGCPTVSVLSKVKSLQDNHSLGSIPRHLSDLSLLVSGSLVCFLFYFIFIEKVDLLREGNTRRKILHSLAHSQSGHNSQS